MVVKDETLPGGPSGKRFYVTSIYFRSTLNLLTVNLMATIFSSRRGAAKLYGSVSHENRGTNFLSNNSDAGTKGIKYMYVMLSGPRGLRDIAIDR